MIILYSNSNETSVRCEELLKRTRHVILYKNDPGVNSEYYKACHDLAPDQEHTWPAVLTEETDMLFGEDALRYCTQMDRMGWYVR